MSGATRSRHGAGLGLLELRQRISRVRSRPVRLLCAKWLTTTGALAALEQSEILGERTRFWSEQLRAATRAVVACRQALEWTAESDIVFLDPDVGLATAAMEKKRPSPKHVHQHELRTFLRRTRRQTVVVYQHHPQNFNDRPSQLDAWDAALRTRLSAAPPQRFTYRNRDLMVLPDDRHAGLLDARIEAFLSGPMGTPRTALRYVAKMRPRGPLTSTATWWIMDAPRALARGSEARYLSGRESGRAFARLAALVDISDVVDQQLSSGSPSRSPRRRPKPQRLTPTATARPAPAGGRTPDPPAPRPRRTAVAMR